MPWRPTSSGAGPAARRSSSAGRWRTRTLRPHAPPVTPTRPACCRSSRAPQAAPGRCPRPPLWAAGAAAAGPAAAADAGQLRPRSGAPGTRRHHLRRARRSAAGSPAPASRSTRRAAALRTALVERDDFASGTSSKSSKLVHGGLRYLQNGDVRLVYEALRERQRLRRNAPHLVRLLPFLIPIFSKDGLINPKVARALGSAMWMYDLTGGARIGKLHKRLKKGQAVAHMPTLPEERLAGAYLYYDAAADDARLTLTHRPHRGARPRRRGRQPHRGGGAAPRRAGRVAAPSVRGRRRGASRSHRGPRRRQRRRRVVRRRPRARRGRAPGHDPARQGHPHHRAVGQGPQRHRRRGAGAEGQALGVRRARGCPTATGRSSSPTSAPPTPTTTAPIDDPAVHRRGRRLPAPTPSTSRCASRCTIDRRRRHLGRAAARS